jgi:hypothetical protein
MERQVFSATYKIIVKDPWRRKRWFLPRRGVETWDGRRYTQEHACCSGTTSKLHGENNGIRGGDERPSRASESSDGLLRSCDWVKRWLAHIMESNGLSGVKFYILMDQFPTRLGSISIFTGVIFLNWAITHKRLGQGHRGQLTPFVHCSSAPGYHCPERFVMFNTWETFVMGHFQDVLSFLVLL